MRGEVLRLQAQGLRHRVIIARTGVSSDTITRIVKEGEKRTVFHE